MWTYKVLALGIGTGMVTLVAAICVLLIDAAEGKAGEGGGVGDSTARNQRGRRWAGAPQVLFHVGAYLYWISAALLVVGGGVVPLLSSP